MANELSRRDFLRQATEATAAMAAGASIPSLAPSARRQSSQLPDPPTIDGSLLYDDAALGMAAEDQGRIVTRRPRAVLRPGSVQDVVRVVQYANARQLPVAMRGRGHSRYGLALVAGGIVIDSRPLNKVLAVKGDSIEVEAGCALSALVRSAFDAGFVLPVMTNCTMLSVGGFLSVGGQSLGSQRFGAFVDQVRELDVVTGDGRLVTCSETSERELFEMTLAGLGQCAIILRARLRLERAPDQVITRTITYDDLEPFLAEQERLLSVEGLDTMSGSIRRSGSAGWEYRLTLGCFGSGGSVPDPSRFISATAPARMADAVKRGYGELFPGAATISPAASPQPAPTSPAARPSAPARRAGPSLAVWLPASAARELVASRLSSADDMAGVTSIECTCLRADRFRRPLFRVPAEERMFAFWNLRTVFPDSGPSLEIQLASNTRFLDRAMPMGAKRYPPYGGLASPSDWRVHYGDVLFRRLEAAKRKYDPASILTPGPGIFT